MAVNKRRNAMKSKSVKNTSNAKEGKLATHAAVLEGRSGSWTQWIEPRGAALLSEMLGPVYFVVKNRGSSNVTLIAHHGDLFDLSPGAVRATYARGIIRVENRSEKPALIEFDFLPIFLK
jgi:hypothetical protein